MLELRPNCELCDKDLPPEAENACICSYECTFCAECVNEVLTNVCPNCGGGFTARPIRPLTDRRAAVSRMHQPASTTRVNTSFSGDEIASFVEAIRGIEAAQR